MTRAKRMAIEEWAAGFIKLTGTPLKLSPEKYAAFQAKGVQMALFEIGPVNADNAPLLVQ